MLPAIYSLFGYGAFAKRIYAQLWSG